MIGYIVRETRSPHWMLKANGASTPDPLLALRFAREEDAEAWMLANSMLHCIVLPLIMSPQYPSELQAVRNAILDAELLLEKVGLLHKHHKWFLSSQRAASKTAHDAKRRAEHLCYELFQRSLLLRRPPQNAKVALPAKA